MNRDLLKILSCPYHPNASLELEEHKELEQEIIEGALLCTECNRVFPIINKIPYLLPDDLKGTHEEVSGFFSRYNKYSIKDHHLKKNRILINWKVGPRTWNADIFSKIISHSHSKSSNLLKKQQINRNSILILDIGCGESPKGNINIDIYIPKEIPENFILASAEYLPFKDNTCDIVESSYVIEHCINPVNFILNQVRISKDKVIIVTDNSEWIGDYWFRLVGSGRIFHDEHYYRWTVEYLDNLLKRLGLRAKVCACNLSTTLAVKVISFLGRLPRIGRLFYRDIKSYIYIQSIDCFGKEK